MGPGKSVFRITVALGPARICLDGRMEKGLRTDGASAKGLRQFWRDAKIDRRDAGSTRNCKNPWVIALAGTLC